MEIVVGKTAGFCFGVSNAVRNVEKLLATKEKIYCLGELVHNKSVMESLEKKGLKIVNNINEVPSKATLVIRTHGVPKQIYNIAKQKDIKLFDLTCRKVLELHKLVEEYCNKNYYILLMGVKEHPENIGTMSFADKNIAILQDREEIDSVIEKIRKSGINKLLIIAQTTFSNNEFNEHIEKIKKKINFNIQIEIINTICDTSKKRQEETQEIARSSELMIIIGGKKSSNANKLYNVAIRGCNNAMLVETKEDLYMNYVRRFEKVGVMAAASTSKETIDEILNILKKG